MQPAERVALAGFFVLLLLVRRYAWSSEADVDELSMLRGSPPVRIRLPGHVPPGAGRFSAGARPSQRFRSAASTTAR